MNECKVENLKLGKRQHMSHALATQNDQLNSPHMICTPDYKSISNYDGKLEKYAHQSIFGH
jgi:hypothetical protein